jgi:copper resistance protein C
MMKSASLLKIAASLVRAATTAFAHARLEKATPAVGGTVSSANEIRLDFSEGWSRTFPASS